MFLRFRNIWFDMASFVLAVAFGVGAVAEAVHEVRANGRTIGAALGEAWFALLLAVVFFSVSLWGGAIQRKARERKKAARDKA